MVLTLGDLKLDLMTRAVGRGEVHFELQPREFGLLEYLMLHVGPVVARTVLLEHVWDNHFDPQTNAIDVHLSSITCICWTALANARAQFKRSEMSKRVRARFPSRRQFTQSSKGQPLNLTRLRPLT